MPYCVKIHGVAERIGSVNTLVRKKDGWHGYNTDYDGLCYLLRESGISLAGKKVLILGSGGAGVMARTVAEDLGAREVITISRSGEDNYENLQKHADGEIIINTTPVGMYPLNGVAPLSLEQFPKCAGVADLIYNPLKTALVLQAEAMGIPAVNGLMMLVAQAKVAAEYFMGKTLDDTLVPAITKQLQQKMQNIVLVGMPGSGKTTVATALGEHLGMDVYDSDEEIVRRAGKSIPEIGEMVGPEIFVAAGSGPNALNIILVIVILASLLEIGVTAFRTLMYGAKK
jgi:shikimate dehydrogenase